MVCGFRGTAAVLIAAILLSAPAAAASSQTHLAHSFDGGREEPEPAQRPSLSRAASSSANDAAVATAHLLSLPKPDAGGTNLELRCKMSDEAYDGPDEAPQCPNEGKCEDAPAQTAEQRYFTQCRGCFKGAPGCKSGFSADPDGYVNPDGGETCSFRVLCWPRLRWLRN
jgi:hypothetical protein